MQSQAATETNSKVTVECFEHNAIWGEVVSRKLVLSREIDTGHGVFFPFPLVGGQRR